MVTITLPPAVYWELRARDAAVEVAEAELLRAQIHHRQAIAAAKAQAAEAFDRLGAPHGLQPGATYTWHDEDCSLARSAGDGAP
jgi:hypothetical protein